MKKVDANRRFQASSTSQTHNAWLLVI